MNYIDKIYNAKRKSAHCRLKVSNKNIGIKVNNIDVNKYFYESDFKFTNRIKTLLNLFSLSKSFSFSCKVNGGGKNAQCEAIISALAKALKSKIQEEFKDDNLTRLKMISILRKNNYLTVDTRKVEPKKYGLRKARSKEQFIRR